MNKQEFQQLTDKISKGEATEREIALYAYYYSQFQEKGKEDEHEVWDNSDTGDHLYQRIRQAIPSSHRAYTGKFYRRIAAAAIIILGLSLYFINRNDIPQQPLLNASKQEPAHQDRDPGGNKAILTLSDGTTLNLDDSQQGLLAKQGASQISKTADGALTYQASTQGRNTTKPLYNSIRIPEGGQYQLTLPDGTKVWLNAGSSLRFPVQFTEFTREVELNGEAFFDVVSLREGNKLKQKRPFVVKTASQTIEVLGTQFNVGAYANENLTKTTLIEGSVKVTSTETGRDRLLRPGQQAQLTMAGQISVVDDIDTEEAIAWTKGMFYFNNTELQTILQQLARWYDVDVDMKNIPDKKFNGELSRNVKLSQVLQMMEKTSGIQFKVEGRRLYMVN
ncbi:FecR family protein [Sphingobacterium thalpophilum]|uniref:FecR family protein n=1 Tax=Sphingobacterium thalpophilum TaxID=259 RepID=UPI003C74DD43